MFANFLYFIVALLILTLYEPKAEPPFSLSYALLMFFVLSFLFAIYTRLQFRRLARQVRRQDQARLDQIFTVLVTRHSILALVVFAVDIWGLHLPSYLKPVQWLSTVPTLNALLFLFIFIGYLCVVWIFAFDAHHKIYRTDISRINYVYSNAAFSIPLLIPWLLLSGISDVLLLLPFDWPKQILNTQMGQLAYFLIFLVIAAIFAPVLIQRFWRCRPLEPGGQRRRIADLCRRAGVRYADIVYWPIFGGRMITAGVMGLVSRFRYILVTNALLELLSDEEIDQVIAHEIGHVKRKHLLIYLLFFIGAMAISYATFLLSYYLVYFSGSVLNFIILLDLDADKVENIVGSIFFVSITIVYFRYVFGYFMRNFERQADIFVFRLFPTAQPLIATFGKIAASSGQPADKPNWHHFSIQQRIDYLRRCEWSPRWISRHDRKVRRSIIAYLAAFAIMVVALLMFNNFMSARGTRYININALEAYIDQKEDKTLEDALRYWSIANIYFEQKDLQRAAKAYEKALALAPQNPEILNNLAWLLATSHDASLSDPPRALELARRAIAQKKAPHIWDTLAECLFANGHLQEAIEAEEKALAMNPEDDTIYKDQLNRFKDALLK